MRPNINSKKAYRHTALDAVSVLAWHNLKQNLPSKTSKRAVTPHRDAGSDGV